MPCDRYLATEHQPEALRILKREQDIGLAHGAQAARRRGLALRHAEALETFRRQRRKERLALGVMPVGGAVRNPSLARNRTQAERVKSIFFDDIPRRTQQRRLQIAVMV